MSSIPLIGDGSLKYPSPSYSTLVFAISDGQASELKTSKRDSSAAQAGNGLEHFTPDRMLFSSMAKRPLQAASCWRLAARVARMSDGVRSKLGPCFLGRRGEPPAASQLHAASDKCPSVRDTPQRRILTRRRRDLGKGPNQCPEFNGAKKDAGSRLRLTRSRAARAAAKVMHGPNSNDGPEEGLNLATSGSKPSPTPSSRPPSWRTSPPSPSTSRALPPGFSFLSPSR